MFLSLYSILPPSQHSLSPFLSSTLHPTQILIRQLQAFFFSCLKPSCSQGSDWHTADVKQLLHSRSFAHLCSDPHESPAPCPSPSVRLSVELRRADRDRSGPVVLTQSLSVSLVSWYHPHTLSAAAEFGFMLPPW